MVAVERRLSAAGHALQIVALDFCQVTSLRRPGQPRKVWNKFSWSEHDTCHDTSIVIVIIGINMTHAHCDAQNKPARRHEL